MGYFKIFVQKNFAISEKGCTFAPAFKRESIAKWGISSVG